MNEHHHTHHELVLAYNESAYRSKLRRLEHEDLQTIDRIVRKRWIEDACFCILATVFCVVMFVMIPIIFR
jgi:hypothetical protein